MPESDEQYYFSSLLGHASEIYDLIAKLVDAKRCPNHEVRLTSWTNPGRNGNHLDDGSKCMKKGSKRFGEALRSRPCPGSQTCQTLCSAHCSFETQPCDEMSIHHSEERDQTLVLDLGFADKLNISNEHAAEHNRIYKSLIDHSPQETIFTVISRFKAFLSRRPSLTCPSSQDQAPPWPKPGMTYIPSLTSELFLTSRRQPS